MISARMIAQLVFGSLFALPLILAALNYSGFCMQEFRWLSSQEKIRAAAQYALDTYPPVLDSMVVDESRGTRRSFIVMKRPDKPIPYSDLAEFFAINPNCCTESFEVGSFGEKHHLGFWARVFGACGFVTVRYQVRFIDEKGMPAFVPFELTPLIYNCGYVSGEEG